jgi:hypothetical protein
MVKGIFIYIGGTKMAKTTAVDLFAAAPTAPAAPKVDAKGKSKRREIPLTSKFGAGEEEKKVNTHDLYAAAKAIATAATTLTKSLEEDVKKETKGHFTTLGLEGKGSDSFTGTSDHANSNCQLRKRATTSTLTPEEVRIAQENNIPLEKKVIKEAVPERFFFNEELLSNPTYREQISKALGKINFGGVNPIIRQAPEEEISSYVTTDHSIDAIFNITAKHDFETQEEKVIKTKQLLDIVGVLALKTQFTGSLKDAFNLLEKAGIKLS